MQANAAVEWQFQARHQPDRRRICSSTATSCRGRSTATSARLGTRTFTRRRHRRRRSPYPLLRRRPAVRATSTRVIAFESTAESRYNGLTLELNRRFANHLQFRAAYTLGKVEDTVPDATAVVPGNRRRRRQVRLEPGGLRRRPHRRQQRPAAPLRAERRLRAPTGSPTSLDGLHARARRRLVVQRDPHRAVRPALHGARRRRRPEQRRQHAQRHRAGHDAQPVPAAVDRHVRSAHRARHPDRQRARCS